MHRSIWGVMGLVVACGLGCAYTRTHDPDKAQHYDERYGHTDLKYVVETLASSMTSRGPLAKAEKPPIVVVLGIQNDTGEHIDTGGIIDKLETRLLADGKARLVNRSARQAIETEMDYQASGKVDPAQVKALGKKLGADYVVTGRFHSIEKSEAKQVRLTRGNMIYYQLALELTEIATDEIMWKDEAEIVTEGRRPIVGW